MADTRRGFLKTLGKLGAAVGLTAAVASTVEAKIPTTPKAKMAPNGGGGGGHVSALIEKNRDMGKFEFGFTGFKADPMAAESLQQLQRDMNLVRNQALDNARMTLHSPMVVPQHVYDYITKRRVIDNLDPYN